MTLRMVMMVLAMVLFINPAAAQNEQSIFEKFAGTWLATGNSFGEQAKSSMIWSETLDGKYYRIDYQITVNDSGANSFTGIGHYRLSDGTNFDGYWADNSGDLHPLAAQAKTDRLTSIWGKAGAKQGRTEYLLLPDGHIQVTDWLLTKTGWREFNKAIFRKQTTGD